MLKFFFDYMYYSLGNEGAKLYSVCGLLRTKPLAWFIMTVANTPHREDHNYDYAHCCSQWLGAVTSCGVTIVINGIRGPAPAQPTLPDMAEMFDGVGNAEYNIQ